MTELGNQLLKAGLIVFVATLSLVLVQVLRRRVLQAFRTKGHLPEDQRQRAVTLVGLGGWILDIVIAAAAVLMLLSNWGVNIVPLLASAGVAGLAISLGAQTLIRDLIGGFFVLIENQYSVGDIIQVGAITGQVERLTLRTTLVRDQAGLLYSIPNGEVRIVANQTKAWSRAVVDVAVAYEENLDRVLHALSHTLEAFAADPSMVGVLLEPPQIVAPASLGDWAITLRVMAKTTPGKQWDVSRELRRRILATFGQENIRQPYPRQEVYLHRSEDT